MQGFRPPPAGTPMCRHLVAHDPCGRIVPPRPCKRAAADDTPYCRTHQRVARRKPPLDVRDGGFCIWCGGAARSYGVDGVFFALCVAHGRSLARALVEGR